MTHYRNIQFNNSAFPLLFSLSALYCFKRPKPGRVWRAGADTSSAASPDKDVHTSMVLSRNKPGLLQERRQKVEFLVLQTWWSRINMFKWKKIVCVKSNSLKINKNCCQFNFNYILFTFHHKACSFCTRLSTRCLYLHFGSKYMIAR